jgi:hypothetical protein
MAKAAIVTLRDEVAKDLTKKSGGWARSFEAVPKYQPKFDFEDTDTLQVQVVPMTWRKVTDSRSEWSHEFVIAVGMHWRADPKSADQATERFDELLKLVEEISDHYEDTRPTVADCVLQAVDFGGGTGLPYAHEVIESLNQFTSVIHLTFRKWR